MNSKLAFPSSSEQHGSKAIIGSIFVSHRTCLVAQDTTRGWETKSRKARLLRTRPSLNMEGKFTQPNTSNKVLDCSSRRDAGVRDRDTG